MKIRTLLVLAGALIGTLSARADGPNSRFTNQTATFTITHSTSIPDQTLSEGTYTLQVVDALLDDRIIVRVDGPVKQGHYIFLAIPALSSADHREVGPVMWNKGLNGKPTIRGFVFGPGATLDFVYPKAQAAELAQTNTAKIVAVDYDASKLKSKTGLSRDDMREVNLWLLSMTTAGPDNKTPALAAKKYEAPAPTAVSYPDQNAQVAQAPATQAQPAAVQPPSNQVASNEQPALPERRPAAVHHKPVIKTLPHTAGDQPLILLAGLLSLVAAAGVRLRRNQGAA